MEHKKSACSFSYWKETFVLIFCMLVEFVYSLFGQTYKKPFGYTSGSYKKSHDPGHDYGRPHGWGGGGYKELRDLGPCVGGG